MVRVLFEYDEDTRKWECYVNGTESHIESRQAFSAVVLTCRELPTDLLIHTQVVSVDQQKVFYLPSTPIRLEHKVIPAVE